MPAVLKLMAISEIMEMVSGSVDLGNLDSANDWWRVIAAKASAAHFDAIVDTIQSEGFGMPMVICDRYSNGNYVIGNGHHRFVAAMLLGLWRIPVMVSEGSGRDDFMRPEDSMDDYGKPIDVWGNEYYQLLQGNMENDGGGDIFVWDDESDHPEFYCGFCEEYLRNSVECCSTDHLALHHPECDNCGIRDCGGCEPRCSECEYDEADCICAVVTPAMLRNDYWHYLYCQDCESYGYAKNHAVCGMERAHDEALTENVCVGPIALLHPVVPKVSAAAWHPVSVLDEAYAIQESMVRQAALEVAYSAWQSACNGMRELFAPGEHVGQWDMIDQARRLVAAYDAWSAL